MLARLILALLLVVAAMPAAAMPAGCGHGGEAAAMPAMTASHTRLPSAPLPAADHGCLGCAALPDWLTERIAPPAAFVRDRPAAPATRLALRDGGPPNPRPPRIG